MERAPALTAALAAAALAAGCGGTPRPAHHAAPPPRVWRANAAALVWQLRADIASAAIGGDTPAAAARALADTSDLYALLVTYSDLGGCRAMVAATGAPAPVARPLGSACAHLQRAAALFARAATDTRPAELVRATREVRLADPHLVRASLALRRYSTTRGEK